MALESLEPTPAPEKIPLFVLKEAVRWVGLGDYFKLRYQSQKGKLDPAEYKQISAGVKVFSEWARENEVVYDPGDAIEPWADFRIGISRNILKNVPLAEYLAARQVALQGQLDWNFEKIGFFGGQDLIEKGKRMTQELLLTLAVAEAADVSFA